MHNALHGRKSDTRSGKFRERVIARERFEQMIEERGVEPGAIVADEVDGSSPLAFAAKFDLRLGMTGRIFPRVAEQILKRNAQQPRVSLDFEAARDLDVHFPL